MLPHRLKHGRIREDHAKTLWLCLQGVDLKSISGEWRKNMRKRNELLEKEDVVSVEPLLVDVKEVSRLLNVCERTVRTLTKSGALPVVKIASRVLYSIEDLKEFVRQQSTRIRDQGEQADLLPYPVCSTMYNPLEWFIPKHRGMEHFGHKPLE